MKHSYYEASARHRLAGVLDLHSFRELLPPAQRAVSPHLRMLDLPAAFDDGIVVGGGALSGKPVLAAAQEGGFMGGAIGEVHGAKIAGLLERALRERPSAVLLLLESGGVRLHEANAGLIAVSEVMRALLAARGAEIPVVALIGGTFGCFGGTGIIARCCDAIVMSEEGRLGMSGPEVIETAAGVEEFDSRDRALVWRTTGGKHRYLLRDADRLVDDDIGAFRAAAIKVLAKGVPPFDLDLVEKEHQLLADRLKNFGEYRDAFDIWRRIGVPSPETLPLMDAATFVASVDRKRS
jgi:malonate decarboxylase beta subunit